MLKKIIVVIIFSICCVYLSLNIFSKEEETFITEKSYFIWPEIELEYYDSVSYEDYIDTNYTLENGFFDTKELGEHEVVVTYYEEDEKFQETINYKVVDNEAPIIMMSSSYTIQVGDEFNYLEKFIIADNYDQKADCSLFGKYDENIVGSYELSITCTDTSENEHSEEFTLNVVGELSSSSYNPTILYFSDIVDMYKNENTKIGIDVSKWQGTIDFEKVKEAGAEFVIIRAGYSTLDADFYEDAYFETNLKNAKEAGLEVGVYFYSQSISADAAIKEAEYVVELLEGTSLDLPIAYDWEIWSEFNELYMSLIDFNNMKNSFINEVENLGYEGMYRNLWHKNRPRFL